MDRKIELEKLSTEAFNDLMLAVNADILNIAKEAQNKINELLFRFNIKCELTLNYSIIPSEEATTTLIENLPIETEHFPSSLPEIDLPKETPIKKKRTRKKSEK
jgi:hypothetical protein